MPAAPACCPSPGKDAVRGVCNLLLDLVRLMGNRTGGPRALGMLAFLLGFAGLLALGLPITLQAAEIGIMPVAVQLDKGTTRTTLSLINHGQEAVTMQAETVTWGRTAVESDQPTDALVINPLIFTIAPGQTQIVRIGLRAPPDPSKEITYRLVLRELPTATLPDQADTATRVRVLMAMRVPVYVAPIETVRKEEWQLSRDAKGNPIAQVRNNGTVHYRVGQINLRLADARDGPAVASANESALLFPGEQRSIVLSKSSPAAGAPPGPGGKEPGKPIRGAVTLEAFTDRGVQYMALDAPGD